MDDLSPSDLERRRLMAAGLSAATLAGLPAPGMAQAAAPVALADFFRAPQLASVLLSPDGRSLLATREVRGRRNLLHVDLASMKSVIITTFTDGDVVSPRWISPDRMVFGVRDLKQGEGGQVGQGLFAIDKDGSEFESMVERGLLSEGGKRQMPAGTFFHSKGVGTAPDEIWVQQWSSAGTRTQGHVTIHRLHTRTLRSTLLTSGAPGRAIRWLFDAKGDPRGVVTRAENRFTFHLRDTLDAPWRVVAQWDWMSRESTPLGFGADGQVYVLGFQGGSDFAGVYAMDPRSGAIGAEPVAALKGYDLEEAFSPDVPAAPGAPLVFGEGRELLGVAYHAERRGVYWLSAEHDRIQQALQAALPGRLVRFSGDPRKKGQPLLVTASSDTEPDRWFLYDQDKRSLTMVGSARPWIDPGRMAAMEMLRYPARDGLSIPASLTVPRGAERRNLPLVVLHYGGPWVRAIQWGFDPTVQFLASRGYAVLMPAPRASTGFGWKHYQAGWKQWGLGMQDDVTDGVRWLVQQGIVDARRVAIMGASYGGYLAMMGLVKDPELYRCAVNWVGVTDPEFMYVNWTDFAGSDSTRYSLPHLLGDPEKDAEQFRRTSPLRRAAEIKRPALLAYGGNDRRVPIINGERMRDALRAQGTEVEWVVYGDEGHNWIRPETRLDFFGRVEKFLARHLS